jgi:hypothetical protein
MEKIKYLPQALLLSFIIKMLLVTTSFSDMGIVFALSGVLALTLHIEKQKEVQDIKDQLNKVIEGFGVIAVEHSKMKSVLEGVKLKNEFVNGNGLKKVI